MKTEFTPAAWRALSEAARWSSGAGDAPLDLPEVLLGLVAEEECRAAAVLLTCGIDAGAIRNRWPALRSIDEASFRMSDFSLPLHAGIAEAQFRLRELPQPLSVATEHLLLGVLCAPGEASSWLTERGLVATELEQQIFRWEGVARGPLEMESIADCGLRIAEVQAVRPQAAGGQAAMFRILDAAANRAREAMRVLEDYVRFVLDDAKLSSELKSMRHQLAGLLARLPAEAMLASRDTPGDVGTAISTESERSRADLRDVIAANFKRLQEALRSLEEYSKTIDPNVAAGLEQLRYQAYTLEQSVVSGRTIQARLEAARLYVLIDGGESIEAFEQRARSLIEAGVHVLQLRDKRLNDRELLVRAHRLRGLTRDTTTLFIMNDRPDLAALSQADGVHVGQEELAVEDARAIVGPQSLIGVSTHSIDQARQAVINGADYIGVGPTFPSGTKQFNAFTGLELLRAVAAEIRLPAFAIGGITLDNLPQVLSTGIGRVAVSGGILSAGDPPAAARQFLIELDRMDLTNN